jgi:acyl-CoA-binding protein
MSDLQSRFDAAAQEAQELSERPDDDTLLKLYALYKQATAGNVKGKRPGFTDFVGRAKYDAWAKLRNKPKEWAMEEYIKLVGELNA